MSLVLTGTAACHLRDEFLKLWHAKKIILKQITDGLSKMDLPMWLQSQILQMVKHRQYDRITCPVEQAMEAAVHYHILVEIMEAE